MHFYVLGALGVGDGARRVSSPRGLASTLFAILLTRANQPVEHETLIHALWSDSQPASASANLRQHVSRLRRFLHDFSPQFASRLRPTSGGYLLEVRPGELDLVRFDDSVRAGRRAFERQDFAAARDHLERGLLLWGGEICQGAKRDQEFETWARYWQERRLEASRLLVQSRINLGDFDHAVAEVPRLIVAEPFCEDLWAALMLALYRSHRRVGALETFRTARRQFVEELGIEPSSDLHDLHQLILRDDPQGKNLVQPRTTLGRRGMTQVRMTGDVGAPYLAEQTFAR